MTGKDAAAWNEVAESFDNKPDHGLRDPVVRAAWRDLLRVFLPSSPATVLDVGCGTGSLAVLLSEAGHSLIGLDLAEGMLRVAKRKAAAHGVAIAYLIADAADPPLGGVVDVVLARHVLWALPDPAEVLARWASLLRPGGRLVLIEGRWATGAGLTAKELEALVRPVSSRIVLRRLDDPSLWGKSITDERYLLMAYGRDP